MFSKYWPSTSLGLVNEKRKMKGEKTWVQPSRNWLVGLSNTITRNESETEGELWGSCSGMLPRSVLSWIQEVDYVPRGSMRQGPWEYRRGVLGVLQAFHVWLEGRGKKRSSRDREAWTDPCAPPPEGWALSCRHEAERRECVNCNGGPPSIMNV